MTGDMSGRRPPKGFNQRKFQLLCHVAMDLARKLASQGSQFILTCHLTQEGSNFRCYLMPGIKGWEVVRSTPIENGCPQLLKLFLL